jgi:hypothetical protein
MALNSAPVVLYVTALVTGACPTDTVDDDVDAE